MSETGPQSFLKINQLIAFILAYYIIFLKAFTIITPPSGTNLNHRHWLALENCKISKLEHFMSCKLRKNLCEVVKFSIFNGKSFQFSSCSSCSFLGLDLLGYDSVFLYMSSLKAVIAFHTWHK